MADVLANHNTPAWLVLGLLAAIGILCAVRRRKKGQ